jgi:hypothetical protein
LSALTTLARLPESYIELPLFVAGRAARANVVGEATTSARLAAWPAARRRAGRPDQVFIVAENGRRGTQPGCVVARRRPTSLPPHCHCLTSGIPVGHGTVVGYLPPSAGPMSHSTGSASLACGSVAFLAVAARVGYNLKDDAGEAICEHTR